MQKRRSLPVVAALLVVIIVATVEWQLALAFCSLGYVASGVLLALFRLIVRRRLDDDDDSDAELPARPLPSRN